MNKQQHHNSLDEQQLDIVLSLFEAGKHPDDIVKKFPKHKEEIFDVLRTVGALGHEANSNMPSKEFFTSMLARVTQRESARYTERGVFSSITSSLIYAFDAVSAHARIALPVAAMALLLVIFVANRPENPALAPALPTLSDGVIEDSALSEITDKSAAPALKSSEGAPSMMAMQAVPPATGNADDVIAAFAESFSAEEAILVSGDSDVAKLIADDGANAYQNFYEKEL